MATRCFLNMTTTSSGSSGGFLAIGMIAWNYVTDAVPTAADTPSVMSPDGDMDWIARWVGAATPSTGIGVPLNPNIFDNTHLVKARRRLGNDRGLLVVFEAVAIGGQFSIDLRTLIKE
jgi:hypothetical protein